MVDYLAPVCLFTYNRLLETRQTLEALKKNHLAPISELFIFSEGPKNDAGAKKVKEVRQFIKNIDGFKSVTIFESPVNKGLANSIISGVTQVIEQYGKVIVLEDDLITSPNFLDFMNQALDFYKNFSKIHSVSGYTLDLPSLKQGQKDYYLGYRASSWGWGTWKEKWEEIDWEVKEYKKFKRNPLKQIQFTQGGSDMPRMLKRQMEGRIDSWAIRWCFDQFLKNQVTVFPKISKVISIGFGDDATHTKKMTKFNTPLDDGQKRKFNFQSDVVIDKKLAYEFKRKFSVLSRLKDKFI